jgi:hypothetical protein
MNSRRQQLGLPDLARLSDDQLVSSLQSLVLQSRSTTAAILAHLIEVERRQLHVASACSSLFTYCTEVLGLSDGETADRIHAARAARRFVVVLELLARNELHLTAVRLLAPHLDDDNHLALLQTAAGKTKRDIQTMIAELAPKPDAPSRINRRPSRRATPAPPAAPDLFDLADRAKPTPTPSPQPQPAPGAVAGPPSPPLLSPTPGPSAPDRGRERAPRPAPLSPGRYKVQFTATKAVVDKLELCKSLMSHRLPGCDLPDVVEEAVELLYAKLSKQRFGSGAKPRGKAARQHKAVSDSADDANSAGATLARGGDEAADSPPEQLPRSRHVPARVRREVVDRDGLRCAYVDPATGRRCSERSLLELHHHEPFAFGGDHSAAQISVYCRVHNQWAARRDFGAEHIDAAIARARDAGARDAAKLPAR